MTLHTRLRLARRGLQALVLLLLVLIPALGRYQALRNQRDAVGLAREWLPAAIHHFLEGRSDSERFTAVVRGSVWTLRVGDLVVSDPLAGVDFLAATGEVLDPFLLTILLPVLLTVLLGRVFCGWICPADLLFEVGSRLRELAGIETDVSFSRKTKYAVLVVGVALSAWLGTQTLAELYPPRLVSGELYGWIWYHRLGVGAWFLLLVLAFEVFVSRRFWCRYVCPGGAVYVGLSGLRRLRLKVERPLCDGCRDCEAVCEFGLRPEAREVGPECNSCGDCLPACPTGALSLELGRFRV